MSIDRRKRQLQRFMVQALQGHLRDTWAKLAGLPVKERVKLAWWLVIGRTELPNNEQKEG